jgi:hypothetical protein
MAVTTDTCASWLAQAQINPQRLTSAQHLLLQAAFRFRQQQGADYYSTRILGHFLLHCGTGLKVAQLARLLHISRPTASRQQALSSKQTVQQAHHRMDGRPYGKLLPRYAGPIAQFLLTHPDATRADLIDFVDATFAVRVSRIALYKFLQKFGLDGVGGSTPAAAAGRPPTAASAAPRPGPGSPLPATTPAPVPAPPFSSRTRTTRARS